MELYKLTGTCGDYVIRFFKCPRLENNFKIPVPIETLRWEHLSEDRTNELFEQGYISKFQRNKILVKDDFPETWFLASNDNKKVFFSILKEENEHLIGHTPNWFDKHKYKIFEFACVIVYLNIIYFGVKYLRMLFF